MSDSDAGDSEPPPTRMAAKKTTTGSVRETIVDAALERLRENDDFPLAAVEDALRGATVPTPAEIMAAIGSLEGDGDETGTAHDQEREGDSQT